jgi:hypothetical protein
MTDKPTPTQIKAFLDDLARISLRHGVMIEDAGSMTAEERELGDLDPDFAGYSLMDDGTLHWLISEHIGAFPDDIDSIDITKLSNHERLEILGGRPHLDEMFAAADLTRMLREAYMAGVNSTGQGWNGEHPGDASSLIEFEQSAAEYAANIVGGEG